LQQKEYLSDLHRDVVWVQMHVNVYV